MRRAYPPVFALPLVAALMLTTACTENPFSDVLGGMAGTPTPPAGGPFPTGNAFTETLLQERTFTDGTAVTTVTYRMGDLTRRPLGVDFNEDGKVDPVVAYGDSQAVVQILLSRGGRGKVDYLSLTLDSKRDMEDLADVAVGDVDGDGHLDIVGAANGAVWYFHHPADGETRDLRAWGNPVADDELRERIDASAGDLTQAELEAIIAQALGPGVNLDDYIVTVEQLYTNVEIADFDADDDNDVLASRTFRITLTPRPDTPVEPLEIYDGDVIVFSNPGGAIDGHNWASMSVGTHERQQRLDRDGASGLFVIDIDDDGDLDVVSSARDDNNVQVAWFENPGAPLDASNPWTQWRIGSVRDAWSIDVIDLTGDDRPDVVAAGGVQQQIVLFEQPGNGPDRSYDWDSHVIVTFENFEPRDVKGVDIDNDGRLEIVAGATEGAVRYFEQAGNVRDEWNGYVVLTYDPPGDVGLLGYGDLDGDGDLDIVAVVGNPTQPNESRLTWIRNDLESSPATLEQ